MKSSSSATISSYPPSSLLESVTSWETSRNMRSAEEACGHPTGRHVSDGFRCGKDLDIHMSKQLERRGGRQANGEQRISAPAYLSGAPTNAGLVLNRFCWWRPACTSPRATDARVGSFQDAGRACLGRG